MPAGGDGAEGSKGKASTIDSVVFSEANIVKQRQFNYKIKVIYYGAASSAGSRGGNAGKGGVGGLGGFGGMALITSISAPLHNSTLSGAGGKEGENGAAGSAGLGGLFGDMGVRGRLLIDGRKEELLSTRYDDVVPIDKRGQSGSVPDGLNASARGSPVASAFNLQESKSHYVDYLKRIDASFRNSFLIERKFIQSEEFKINM